MKALTICQPYAELIASGQKLIENRTWPTNYRGPLLVHAGKSKKYLSTYDPLPEHMDFGAIVAVCCLVGCNRVNSLGFEYSDPRYENHAEGPWCWILRDVRRFAKPIPYRGAQGLFDVPDDLMIY